MNLNQLKILLRQNRLLYLTGLALVLGLKLFYSRSDSDGLAWILSPTARWVGILSGLSFENLPHTGYINHDLQFIIAKSCSGLQFMCICMATLIFSYVHRMRSLRKGFGWIGLSLLLSYIFTVFVNGFRILLAVLLPPFLEKAFYSGAGSSVFLSKACRIYSRWLTPDNLHTLIGTVVYFSNLFVIYRLAGLLSLKVSGKTQRNRTAGKNLCRLLPPAFWYFFIVLGIPVLHRAYRNDFQNFISYAGFVALICSGLLLLFALMSLISERRHRSRL